MISLLRQLKRSVHAVWSRWVLRYRGFNDFYSFPFEVSDPLNEYAEETLEKGCSLLESLGVAYFLCDGTILGIVRDNRLIPHDNDIDVCVVGGIDVPRVKAAFAARGFTVGRELYYRGVMQQLIFYSAEHVIFDICFWHKKGDGYGYQYVPELKKGRRQHDHYCDSHDYVTFRGKRYPTHANIKQWLQEHYGDDWTIPKQVKGDWRLDVKDIIA